MSTHSYGDHELQKIKVWNYNPNNKHTYIYIHGGAWRDPKKTYDELAPVAESTPDSTFIGINYRLMVKHPLHLTDVAKAIIYIVTKFQLQEKHLLGYSVGATLILQLLQFKYHFNQASTHYDICCMDEATIGNSGSTAVLEELNQIEDNDDLIDKLDTLIKENKLTFSSIKFLDGIYDLPELIKEYPQYNEWVSEAYPSHKLIQLNSLSNQIHENGKLAPATYSSTFKIPKIYIVHSLQDELLSLKQTQLLQDFFNKTTGCIVMTGNWGKHDDIYGKFRKEIFLASQTVIPN